MTAPWPRDNAARHRRLPSRRGGRLSPQTVSAAGRRAGFARLAGARRGLVGSARALAAAALLALTGALALPATAEAQTAITLVSTVNQAPAAADPAPNEMILDGGSVDHKQEVGQEFTTGMNEDGYTLTGVDIVSASSTAFTAKVCDALSDSATCWDLTDPGSFGVGTLSFTVPTGTTRTLAKATTYAVVLTTVNEDSDGWTTTGWGATRATGEDAGAAAGWSIADGHREHTRPQSGPDFDGPWTSSLVTGTLRIAIKGTVVGGTSSDATLSALTVTAGGTDLVTFASGTTDYTPMVANDVDEVTVTAMTTDSGATFEYLDGSDMTLTDADTGVTDLQVALAVGETVIKVKVTAEDGNATQTYMVTVTRAAPDTTAPTLTSASAATHGSFVSLFFSENLDLSEVGNLLATIRNAFSLTVDGVEQEISRIVRGFGAGGANRLLVYPSSKIYSGLTVVVSYDQSEAGTDAIADPAGNEVADFTTGSGGVPAVVNSSTQTPSSDATLSALTVTADGTALVTFASDTETYTASVANAVDEVTVTAMTTDSGAMFEYLDGSDMTLTDADTGVDGHQVTLAVGDTVIKVTVTAEDGTTTQTYMVTVTRAAAMTPTCTLNTGDLWCGVVTVGEIASGGHGFVSISGGNVGDLTDNSGDRSFTIGTSQYVVYRVAVSSFGLSFAVTRTTAEGVQSPGLLDDDRAKLHLHVDGHSASFAFSDVALSGSLGYEWSGASLDWSSTGSVTVRLREVAALSSDATLSGLTVTGGGSELVTFVSGTTTYTASVANDVDEVTVTAALNDSGASIEYLDGDDATLTDADTSDPGHQVALAVGDDTVIKVKVTAEDGNATQTYTVTVTRAAAMTPTCTLNTGDIWCGTLTVAEFTQNTASGTSRGFYTGVSGNLVPDEFTDDGTSYSVYGIYYVTEAVTGSFAAGTLVLDGNPDIPTGLTFQLDGAEFSITSETATNFNRYLWASSGLNWSVGDVVTARLNRATPVASIDATLSDLTVTAGGTDLVTFASGTVDYTAMVESTVDEVTVTATKTETNATIEYLDGSDMTLDDADTGTAGHQVPVAVGDTVIKVKVTAQDTTTFLIYTVTVSREAPPGPPAPTNFVAKPGNEQVVLSWDAPASDSGVTRHDYQFKTDGSYGNWTAIANSAVGGANEASFTVTTGLTNEVPHTFQLRVVSGDGDGAAAMAGPVTPTPGICDRTQQVQDEILRQLSGVDDCAAVTVANLASVTELVMEGKSITSLKAGDFAGLTAVTYIDLTDNQVGALPGNLFSGLTSLTNLTLYTSGVTSLPADAFSGLTALTSLVLDENTSLGSLPANQFSGLTKLRTLQLGKIGMTELDAGLFSGLTELTELYLTRNELTSLPAGVFSGLSKLEELYLSYNQLTSTSLPDGVFSGLTALTTLRLDGNPEDPLPLTVTLEKVEGGQVRAKVLAGAPSDLVLPVSVENGTLAFGATGLQVAKGSVAGAPVSVIRTEETGDVTVDLGTPLPSLPRGHQGYEYVKAASELPVEVPDALEREPGKEGQFRLAPDTVEDYSDDIKGRLDGHMARVEVFHAERWGTVCSDGFSKATTFRFIYETATSTMLTETEPANEAPALVCQSMGYATGEYASGYGQSGVPSQPSGLGITIHYPVGSSYLPGDPLPIWLDDLTCAAGDADLTGESALRAPLAHCGYAGWGLHNCSHGEDAGVRCWNEAEDSATAGVAEPLTASFEGLPEAHDGETAFSFRLAFSEAVAVTPEAMRTRVLTAAGGAVTGAARVDGESGVWEITVTPDSREDLSIALTPTEDCEAQGAVCTSDGRALSVVPAHIVPGPGPETEPALTASFEGLPEAHDGEEGFHFRVAFSEEIGIGFRSMRDDSFTVDGGEVTKARRVDRRHDLWRITVEPDGEGDVTVTLAAGRECAVSGAICTRGENRRQLANTPAATVAGPVDEAAPAALTASFVQAPAEHDGETAFKLRVAFSEGISIGFRTFRDQSLSVSGGSVKNAKRVDRRKDLWEVTVKPGSLDDVTVTLEGGRACGTAGAVCTGDGRALSATISTTVLGPAALSVADARVHEAEDALLVFEVTLNRARHAAVTVDYVTSDVTARAGEDYTSASGTLRFATGERLKTVEVTVLDDAHDEGEETLTLTLSNPSGAYLADATATGTIENTDPMPKAWMVRFGRTVGSQVVDALNARLDGAGGSHVTVAGINLIGAPGLEPQAEDDDPFGLREWAKNAEREPDARTITAEDILLRSAFHLSSGGDGTHEGGPAFTAWGRVATGGFEAEEDGGTMDGDVTTGLVGFDAEWERALAGVMLSQSSGDGSYRLDPAKGDDAGTVESSLTGVYPYANLDLNARVSAWALAGVGSGELTLKREGHRDMPTDISMRMGAVGVKGKVLDGTGASGVALNVKSDAMWVGTKSADTGELDPTEGDVTRLRFIVEGERGFDMGGGSTFTPSAEVGLRHDGGDAETGTGVEVGAGLRYTVGAVTLEAQARTLLVHEASGYEDWGASGAIRVTPDASGRGLTLSIAPVWGRTGSAAERLWSARDARALGGDSEFEADSRIALDAGYGFGLAHRRGVLTPYAGLTLGDAGNRTVRTGTRWQGPDAMVALEGSRQASDAGEADNRLMLRVALRF